ncbi:S41 family peptidase [Salinimicrobium terrae]|uniref:S41 family peptidase n=1 Tax=Salinimicrobium terrae TaxID=470866 RepID=UPI0004131340|nr:S41 family peptidase [Salinimicrobium terrae]
MKKFFMPVFLLGIFFTSCSKDEVSEEVDPKTEVEERDLTVDFFIHRAMADWYLYEAEVPELQKDFFESTQEKKDFFADYDAPEDVYEKLQASHDRFSFMWDDYTELEKMLYSGIEKTTGMIYAWGGIGDGEDVFVITRYVLPNSSADQAGIERGDIFMEVDGQQLTRSNYRQMLSQDSFTVSYAEIGNDGIGLTGQTADLTGSELAENPVHIAKVIEHEGLKVGYLMYNGFTSDFDPQLNEAFGYFKSQGVDELVIDLRYNGGGSVETASDLASMITGGFEGEILAEMIMNEKWKAIYEKEAPEYVNFRFNNKVHTGEQINSLNLGRVYVIATFGSASASELLINGLDPYIDVVHIGSNTAGKYQSSRTLYDSDHVMFAKQNVNPAHKYAIQPLISKIANSDGRSDYDEGLTPDISAAEGLNYLPLGDPEEPMLKVALNAISGGTQGDQATGTMKHMVADRFEIEGSSDMFKPTYQRMYINEVPVMEMK